jgi:hypothetical protein
VLDHRQQVRCIGMTRWLEQGSAGDTLRRKRRETPRCWGAPGFLSFRSLLGRLNRGGSASGDGLPHAIS